MNEEELLFLIKSLAESIAEEGPAFNPVSFFTNSKLVVKALAPSKLPSPAERHAIATDRHIDDLCKDRDRMAQELAETRESHAIALRELKQELMVVIESQRDRLDWFEPHYEGLKRDYDNIKSLNFTSLAMITVGGCLIGTASFLNWDVPKFSALAAGTMATVYGLWTQGLVVYKSPSSKERPERRKSLA
jgi:hypothetical protein